MPDIRVFMSYDTEHDGDLYARILEQSKARGSGFEITAHSERSGSQWEETARRRIRNADEVIIICGQHTEDCDRASTELRIAQEEHKPYFLLWGRREIMCTRPAGAKPGDPMYSWTREILSSQISQTLRNSKPPEIPADCRRAGGGGRSG